MRASNKIVAVFSDSQKNTAIAQLDSLKSLMPFLVSLTSEERKNLTKINGQNLEYIKHNIAGAKAIPNQIQNKVNLPEMEKDLMLINNLIEVQNACKDLLTLLNDTLMAGSVDPLSDADRVFSSLNETAKNCPEANAIVQKIPKKAKNKRKSTNLKPQKATTIVQQDPDEILNIPIFGSAIFKTYYC